MKKMRKLIPAFAMLMVAAIMMTTASFAWFTMNESVTATGMQVQAKASGSLVIDDEALTYQSGSATVSLADATVNQLSPIHYDETAKQWQTPKYSSAVHPTYGTPGVGGLVETTPVAGTYFDKVIYLGTAGETALDDQDVTITLTAPTSAAGDATKAYSVAIYVLGTVTKDTDAGMTIATATVDPVIVHVDNVSVDGDPRHIVTIEDLDIPSIVGVGDQNDNKTGLKIGLRVFVDGGLASPNASEVNTGYYVYTAATTREDGKEYFYSADNAATYTELSDAEVMQAIGGKTPVNCWYTKSGDTYTLVTTATDITADAAGVPTTKYYVRNYAAANLDGVDVGGTLGAGFYTREPVKATINQHYVSGAAPSTGSILALEFKTTLPTT